MDVPPLRLSIELGSAGRTGGDVTDFGRSCSRIGGRSGVCVDIRHRCAAELVGDGLEHLAGGGVFDCADSAADVDAVADAHADSVSNVDDDGVSADVGNNAGIGGFNNRQGSGGVVELRGAIGDRFVYGFAEDGLAKITTGHAEAAATAAVACAAASAKHQTGARRFAVAG